MDQGLIYTRLGNPIGKAELAARGQTRGPRDRTEDPLMTHPLSQRIADVLRLAPDAPAIEYDGQWLSWGDARRHWPTGSRRSSVTARDNRRSGSCCATGRHTWRRFSACCSAGGTVVVINPSRGDDRTRADIDRSEPAADHRRARRPDDTGRTDAGTTVVSISDLAVEPKVVARAATTVAANRRATAASRCGC